MRSRVVLPQPDGPTQADELAGADGQRNAVDRLARAIGVADAGEAERDGVRSASGMAGPRARQGARQDDHRDDADGDDGHAPAVPPRRARSSAASW